jgi:tape measure domain-containing protein
MGKSSALKVFFDVDGVKSAIRDFAGLDKAIDGVGDAAENAKKPVSELPEEMQAAARAAENQMRSLGIRTERTAASQIRSIEAVKKNLKEQEKQGLITAREYAVAVERANEKIERITRSTTRQVETFWDRVIQSIQAALARLAASVARISAALTRLSVRSTLSGFDRLSGGFLTLGRAASSAAGMVARAVASIGKGIGTIAGFGGAAFGGAVLGGGAASGAFLKAVADTSGEFERIATALKATTGDDFERATAFVAKVAGEVTFSQEQISQSLLRLRNFGFGQGSAEVVLPALIDQVAKLGGTYEDLEGITLAAGQAWAKQKLQGEEILQMVERGIPVWELLQKVTGKSVQEIQKMSEAGELGRETMALLFQEIGKSASGSAAGQLNTYGGLVARLEKAWKALLRAVGESGVFDIVKKQIETWIEYLGRPQTIGMATRFAQIAAEAMVLLSRGIMELLEVLGPRSLTVLRDWINRAAIQFSSFIGAVSESFEWLILFVDSSVSVFETLAGLINRVAAPALNALSVVMSAVAHGFSALDNNTTEDFILALEAAIISATAAIVTFLSRIDPEGVAAFVQSLGGMMAELGRLAQLGAEGQGVGAFLERFNSVLLSVSEIINLLSHDMTELFTKGFAGADLDLPLLQELRGFIDGDMRRLAAYFEAINYFMNNPGEFLLSFFKELLEVVKEIMQAIGGGLWDATKWGIGKIGDGLASLTGYGRNDGLAQVEELFKAPEPAAAPVFPGAQPMPAVSERIAIDFKFPSGQVVQLEGLRSAVEELRREQARLNSTMSY